MESSNYVAVTVPFFAILVVLAIMLTIFEVRRRKMQALVDKGYRFVVNPYGKIIATIAPNDSREPSDREIPLY